MRQPPLSERGATKWRGMFRNNQKSPYRKIANCAKVIIVSRPAPLLMTFWRCNFNISTGSKTAGDSSVIAPP